MKNIPHSDLAFQTQAVHEVLLDNFYHIPDPLASIEEFARWRHADLNGMTRAELLHERARLRFRLTIDDAPPVWCLQRLETLTKALRDAD